MEFTNCTGLRTAEYGIAGTVAKSTLVTHPNSGGLPVEAHTPSGSLDRDASPENSSAGTGFRTGRTV
ncbi:hypothetical protein BFN03_12315 [Rhodococcus sp. WMMA185]|nr:hypothetical protein BFN03_12315 [Rhodococcus sp. WMMA185]